MACRDLSGGDFSCFWSGITWGRDCKLSGAAPGSSPPAFTVAVPVADWPVVGLDPAPAADRPAKDDTHKGERGKPGGGKSGRR